MLKVDQGKLKEVLAMEMKLCGLHPMDFSDIILFKWLTLKRPRFHEELYELCLKAQRGLVMAPRFFGKSVIFARSYPLWVALTKKDSDYLIISATEAIAVEQLRYIRQELESNQKLRAYFGDQITDKWTQDEVRLKNGSRLMAKGQGFQIRGLHPTHVTCDDLESEHVVSEDQRKKLDYWFSTTLKGALGKEAQLLVVGTVLHPESLLLNLAKEPDWKVKRYSALDEGGKSIWEEKAPTQWLLKLKAENEYAFQQEYMNNPLRSGETVFREEWLSLLTPFPPPRTEVVFTAVDPAISKKETADKTAIVTFGVVGNGVYELEAKQGRWSVEETIQEVSRTYQTWMPIMIGVEEVAYQKALIEVLNRQSHPWTIQPMKADKDKRRRALAVSGMFQQGRVHLSTPDLISQLKLFTGTPADGEDDLVDAAVHALRMIQLYCWPAPLKEQDDRTHLSFKEKAIWDGVHRMNSMAERRQVVDSVLGDEW